MPITKPYKWNLKKIQKLASKQGGYCISKEYKNPREKLLWKCKNNHEWMATLDSVRRGSWCLKCRNNRPLSLDGLKNTAKEREGKLISTKYNNSQQKLQWQCKYGHIWSASGNNIRNSRWCPYCAGRITKEKQFEKMHELAKQFWGKCLSTNYKNSRYKLQWECAKGHRWFATPELISQPLKRGVKV